MGKTCQGLERKRGRIPSGSCVAVPHGTSLSRKAPANPPLGEVGHRLTGWVSGAALLPQGRLLRKSASYFLLRSLDDSHLAHFPASPAPDHTGPGKALLLGVGALQAWGSESILLKHVGS